MFGKSRQGYYKALNYICREAFEEELVLSLVLRIRKKAKTSRWGLRKMYPLIERDLIRLKIKIGRDKLFDLLRMNGLLVSKRKRKFFTTQSHHWLRKYQNLVENMVVSRPNQLWVSDITYVELNGEVMYLYLITDAYSQKIVGWNLSQDLKAESALYALNMAFLFQKNIVDHSLVHHSDRGVQYCSYDYTDLLKKKNVWISMTKPASPQENAIAERVNGILKEEWLVDIAGETNAYPKKYISQIIKIYNDMRPHEGLGNLTPNQVHDKGFKRHDTERVIGKKYNWKKKTEPIKARSENSNAIGPNDYSLASCSSAELASASSWYCKIIETL
ncbi:IS3 family transposase [Aquiflexum sp. LQ15W]|uniref:IS3 family transposase n=1 Tax=Cognataquiflexum nitidum TaxID=2922272 RepID=UPI001F13283F|nr:IS3 family transposase [Cognataquiflexum nitidum]MCH6198285.1 IS3 family transposase [Cognataquiflexum nitidum]